MRFSAFLRISPLFALTLVSLFEPAAAAEADPARADPACDVMVYEDGDFNGERLEVTTNTPYVGDHWSDRISSIRVRSGKWQFFKDSAFGGDDVLAYGPGDYPRIPANWNDRIRSLRCLDDAARQSAPTSAAPLASDARAAPVAPSDGGEESPAPGHAESFDTEYGPTPFYSGRRPYGWYGTGWHGAGFYMTGSRWLRGYGWGGPEGWHGWHRSFWYRDAYHRGFDRHDSFGRGGDGFHGGSRFGFHAGGFRDGGFHGGGFHGGGYHGGRFPGHGGQGGRRGGGPRGGGFHGGGGGHRGGGRRR